MVTHLEIDDAGTYTVKVTTKIDNSVVAISYFERTIIAVQADTVNNLCTIILRAGIMMSMTHDQSNISGDVYIVDKINNVAPTSITDLADKLNGLMRI